MEYSNDMNVYENIDNTIQEKRTKYQGRSERGTK